MIKSMTGFASVTHEDELTNIGVTARSVNHRYLDVQIRVPQVLAELEHRLRGLVQEHVARGRVELGVTLRLKTHPAVDVELNESLVDALVRAAHTAREDGRVEHGLTAGDLLRFPQVVTVREHPTEEDVWQTVCARVADTTTHVLGELDRMRRREGEFLRADLAGRVGEVRRLVDRIVAEAAAGDSALRARLSVKVAELGATVQTDPAAVAQEVVRWVARSDIHEEVARLRGHIDHLLGLAEGASPCGRKLDFLVQEMNREVNTIGSKAEGRGTGELVVAGKAELEKLREQIQNVE